MRLLCRSFRNKNKKSILKITPQGDKMRLEMFLSLLINTAEALTNDKVKCDRQKHVDSQLPLVPHVLFIERICSTNLRKCKSNNLFPSLPQRLCAIEMQMLVVT